ncbi:methyl-accepting chemotaxis protein [Oceanospirillum sp.]|uniref:methyl-accepting chemotaxis protein n=1 Tax=Oceanospirillum sp. TaxID=2021254 RepID=UPI003A910CFE
MFKNISIPRALQFVFGAAITAIIALSIHLLVSINGIQNQFVMVVDRNVSLLTTVSDLRYYTVTYRRFALDYGLTNDASEHKKILETIRFNDEKVAAAMNTMEQLADTGKIKADIREYQQRIDDYRKMQENYINLINSGRIIMARKEMLGPMLAPFNQIVSLLSRLQEDLEQEAIAIKEAEAERISGLIRLTSVVVAVITAFLVMMSIMISRKVTRPLERLVNQMQAVEQGDLSKRLNLQDFAKDELGSAAHYFDRMQAGLSTLAKEINESVKTLEDTSSSLRNKVSETTGSLDTQRSEISQIAAATEQMQAGFSEVVQRTLDASEQSNQAKNEAQESQSNIQKSVDQSEALAGALSQTAEVVLRLQEDSHSISVISEVIGNITEQTNLLALNAAIEAARAGEAGRGFAVVADEVRQLAQKTQASLSEISDIIESLQKHAGQAAEMMGNSEQQMQTGLERIRDAGNSFGHILSASEQIAGMSTQIATATEEQTAVARDLSESVSAIHMASDRIADGALETQTACDALSQESDHLSQLAGRFKLS